MLDQLFGYVLFILGVKTVPSQTGTVQGETTSSVDGIPPLTTPTIIVTDSPSETQRIQTEQRDSSGRAGKKNKDFQKHLEARKKEMLAGDQQFTSSLGAQASRVKQQIAKDTEQFLSQVKIIRNTEKAERVIKIQEKLTHMNTNRTQAMTKKLTTMSEILKKIIEKAASATGDTTSLQEAIMSAQTAISDAQTAVSEQTGKSYTIQITQGEATLKNDVKSVKDVLKTDIQAVEEKIKAARIALKQAIKALRESVGRAAPSGTTTPATPL